MNFLRFCLILFLGIFLILMEFQLSKTSSVLGTWEGWEALPIIGLFILTAIATKKYLYKDVKAKDSWTALSILTGVILLMTVIGHIIYVHRLDTDNVTQFMAYTYDRQFGNDGGLILDFKRNGHLKAERRDHWAQTFYWGRYTINKDTVILDIALDFKLGKYAIFNDTTLRFLDDKAIFNVTHTPY
jgi:hypothetical protein